MTVEAGEVARDLFRYQNAKEMTADELVSTFVPTKTFDQALVAKNQILLGTRGSGKTALARMLSHSHLVAWASQKDPGVRPEENVCTYISCSDLMGARPTASTELVRWIVNAATVSAFLETASSCLRTYCPNPDERLV